MLLKSTEAEQQQCNKTVFTKRYGKIEYSPSPVRRRRADVCEWKFIFPETKPFILVLELDFLKNYGENDHLILADGV